MSVLPDAPMMRICVVIMKSGTSVAIRAMNNTVHVHLALFVTCHRVLRNASPSASARRALIVMTVAPVSHATFVDRMNTGTSVAVPVVTTNAVHRQLLDVLSSVLRDASAMKATNVMRRVCV